MAQIRSKQDEDLIQLTLQLRNRKDNDEKYAKFRGDNLIGVCVNTLLRDLVLIYMQNHIVPKVGFFRDLVTVLQPKNWPALKQIFGGFIRGTGLDVRCLNSASMTNSNMRIGRRSRNDCRQSV